MFDWALQSFVDRWPSPLDVGYYERKWQKSEEAIRRCLFPQSIFNLAIDSVLNVAKDNDFSIKVIRKGRLTYIMLSHCTPAAIVCIDEDNRAFNVDIDYGDIDELVRKAPPACSGEGCSPGEKRTEESRSEVVRRASLLAEDFSGSCGKLCIDFPHARPIPKTGYARERLCDTLVNEQAKAEYELDKVEHILYERSLEPEPQPTRGVLW